ncbi:hypothetical protein TNCV_3817351 [Trichonephila clavipes]|nr:hypothetical protein TNCV_3817351 [Trichonephila clavipes]
MIVCRATAKFVPQFPSVEQKELRIAVSQTLMDTINPEPGNKGLLTVPENENFQGREDIRQSAMAGLN